MKKEYIPVDCGFMDLVEDAATRKQYGKIEFFTPGGELKKINTQVKTWTIENGEEFLITFDGFKIRLDRLYSLFGNEGPSGPYND